MNFRYMCFIFLNKEFQLHLRKLLKVVLFVGVVFFEKGKRVALAKLAFVAEEKFPFLTNYL